MKKEDIKKMESVIRQLGFLRIDLKNTLWLKTPPESAARYYDRRIRDIANKLKNIK